MEHDLYQTLPLVALAGFVATGLFIAVRPSATKAKGLWLVPAALASLFLAWSLYVVSKEGLLAFWPEHTRNAWGNQIWFDLLLSAGSAFSLLAPRARAAGMRPVPWFIFIVCTGSIGLLAMLARYMFVAEREEGSAPAPLSRGVQG
ncbi:hypothetical protein [Phenylobacterium montanum]|uniref:DUF2834 domain-containing protein n=1 Tax=Phenylobacterium montanum TaxID=2823693 RepID=A0A975FZW6_9CAUL|nr:hypothetical protein [Caulobacter sp. S6]QUD87897.1 hypothetical protein KCG34_23120 [Caulobacter sp. S6]